MKRRPSPGSPRKPAEGVFGHGAPSRLAKAIGAAAGCAILVGVGVSGSSAPPSLVAQPAALAAGVDRQALQLEVPADVRNGALPAAGEDAQAAVNPLIAPIPAAQQPAAPGTPAAPIADLRRASIAFEAAAGKASAPGARPAPDPDSRPPMPDFTGAARGVALGELQARFDEFAHNEWVQTGSVTATGTERAEVVTIGGVPTHRFSTCIDSSAIEIRDAAGVVVLAAAPAGTRKAMNTYDIQQQKGIWVVVGHSFPDSAAC